MNDLLNYRQIAESYFNKKLAEDEMVHHIDGNHNNNKPENLVIMKKSQHSKVHVLFNFETWRYERTQTLCNSCFFCSCYEGYLNKRCTVGTIFGLLDVLWKFKPDIRIAEFLYQDGMKWKQENDHDCYMHKHPEVVRRV